MSEPRNNWSRVSPLVGSVMPETEREPATRANGWSRVSPLMGSVMPVVSTAATTGTAVTVDARAASVGEAERKGRAALRAANKNEVAGSLTLMGDVRLVAGLTIKLEHFAAFAGTYIIEKATHSVTSSGYVTKIDVRRVLEGY